MFCTSTLLEGVNLPAKNIFILNNKKDKSNFTPIDFWNLAGRAGRLRQELSGNIFCIRQDEKAWKRIDVLKKKEGIRLKPTITKKAENSVDKIEALLLGQSIETTKQEQAVLQYIANIICVDTLELNNNYESPIIKELQDNQQDDVISYAKKRTEDIEIPLHILSSNQTIDLDVQNNVYKFLRDKKKQKIDIRLPHEANYEKCLKVLNWLSTLYEWVKFEGKFKHTDSLKYFALLMTKWINGVSLNQIINESITFYKTKGRKFYINHKAVGRFNENNKEHVNALIHGIIEDIEEVLRFTLEKYFNHFYLILIDLLGEENAGANWALYLEYGTQNRIIIALQNLGLSRHSANYLYKNHRNCLIIENDKLKDISKERLLQSIIVKRSIDGSKCLSPSSRRCRRKILLFRNIFCPIYAAPHYNKDAIEYDEIVTLV